jgi:hypothetical protein
MVLGFCCFAKMNSFDNLRINSGEKLNWLEKIVLNGFFDERRT